MPNSVHSGLVDPFVLDLFLRANIVLEGVVVAFGIVGNVINVIVFRKLGYHDNVNITLTALAVSDIGSLVTWYLNIIMVCPWFYNAGFNFETTDVAYVFAYYPHSYFIRVSGFITAFAAFERCLSVAVPLQIKRIITKKVTLTFIFITFSVMTMNNIFPIQYVTNLQWFVSPVDNTSFMGINFHSNRNQVFSVSYFVTDVSVPYLTFAVLIFCTVVIMIRLKQSAQWRSSVGPTNKRNGVSNKEKRLMLMLATVAVFFIVCEFPQTILLSVAALVRSITVTGKYYDVTLCCYFIIECLENINCGINTVVYYKMSNKYRQTFHSIFSLH